MNNTDFNIETALELLNSQNPFPVDFNVAWQWMKYSRKDNAKVHFLKCNFIEGIDYHILLNSKENSNAGRPTENIILSVDCFKMWAMMSNTQQGVKVRQYFLECEKMAKEKASKPMSPTEMLVVQSQTLLAQAQALLALEQEQARQKEQIQSLERLVHQHDGEIDRLFSPNGHYFSIMGYFASKGIPVSKEMAQRIGKSCTKYCKEENIPIQKLQDTRYGHINAYPEEIIERFIDF